MAVKTLPLPSPDITCLSIANDSRNQHYDGGCIHRRCKLWCSSPTRYPEQTIYSLRQLKAVHGLQRHTSWQCLSVAGQSYSWPSRIGSQTALQIRTLYWLVKSVQVQEAGKKYELMVNQITKNNEHRLIRKCPSSWSTLATLVLSMFSQCFLVYIDLSLYWGIVGYDFILFVNFISKFVHVQIVVLCSEQTEHFSHF